MRKKHQVYDYIANEIRCSYFSKKKGWNKFFVPINIENFDFSP